MTPETLKKIKEQIRKFRKVVEPIAEHWHSADYKTMMVLLQNMGADTSNTHGYNHYEDVKELNKLLDIFQGIAMYYDSHFENWIYTEISMIISGNVMSEDYPDEVPVVEEEIENEYDWLENHYSDNEDEDH
jgi:hypothetical protein